MAIEENKLVIPSWVISVTLPIIISALGYFFVTGKQLVVLETNDKAQQIQIQKLEENKADALTIKYIGNQIDRIEKKLDDLQLQKKDKR